MSRFADSDAEYEVALPGACACPGAPHERDLVWVKGDYSSREVVELQRVSVRASEMPDDNLTLAPVLAPYVRRWNLLDRNGSEVAISAATIEMLRPSDLEALVDGLAAAVVASGTVPNASGAPSAASLPGSASPTP